MARSAGADDLLRQLAQLNTTDLRVLLTEVFPSQAYEGERTIKYARGTEREPALSLVYRAARSGRPPDGAVSELRREAALQPEDVDELRRFLAILQGPPRDHLASFFHFSSRPVSTWWRYRDEFQIMPPPPDAPLPGMLVGDWPFLIEARYRSPDHFGFEIQYRMRTMNRLRLLLPVWLIGPKFKPHTERNTKHWVVPFQGPATETQPPNGVSRLLAALRLRRQPSPAPVRPGPPVFAQEYYEVEGRVRGGPDLSSLDPARAAPLVEDHEAYYRTMSRRLDDVVEFPAILSTLFDTYYALDEETARRYRRACYWFNLGNFLYGYSGSASFFALVAAIESLLPGGEGPHPCAECGASHYPSLTKAFRGFLETYVPDKPEREAFYDLRSKIAHGSRLLHFDLREEWSEFHPVSADEDTQIRQLQGMCRVALVNWLLAQGTG
ncbi:hypothetical protein J5X84_39370 [Streptosporangiaceae bacterium NEAU-GS5]|nr:hypothetical protein [Streptosporangiaceae bacterium NEAU-GS5]